MKRILLVDDDKMLLDSIETSIEGELENVQVFTANDGKDAWDIFKDVRPDLVITDHRMSNWSGEDFTKAIRKEDRELPVILMTGLFDEFDTNLYDDILYKPFRVSQFMEAALRHISSIKE